MLRSICFCYPVALRLRGKDRRYGRTEISCFRKGGDGNGGRSIGCRDEIIGRSEATTRRAWLLSCDFESVASVVEEACDFIPASQQQEHGGSNKGTNGVQWRLYADGGNSTGVVSCGKGIMGCRFCTCVSWLLFDISLNLFFLDKVRGWFFGWRIV